MVTVTSCKEITQRTNSNKQYTLCLCLSCDRMLCEEACPPAREACGEMVRRQLERTPRAVCESGWRRRRGGANGHKSCRNPQVVSLEGVGGWCKSAGAQKRRGSSSLLGNDHLHDRSGARGAVVVAMRAHDDGALLDDVLLHQLAAVVGQDLVAARRSLVSLLPLPCYIRRVLVVTRSCAFALQHTLPISRAVLTRCLASAHTQKFAKIKDMQ